MKRINKLALRQRFRIATSPDVLGSREILGPRIEIGAPLRNIRLSRDTPRPAYPIYPLYSAERKTALDLRWSINPHLRFSIWSDRQALEIVIPSLRGDKAKVMPFAFGDHDPALKGKLEFVHIQITRTKPSDVNDASMYPLSVALEDKIPTTITRGYLDLDFSDLKEQDYDFATVMGDLQQAAFEHYPSGHNFLLPNSGSHNVDADLTLLAEFENDMRPTSWIRERDEPLYTALWTSQKSAYFDTVQTRVRTMLDTLVRVRRFDLQQVVVHWYSGVLDNGDADMWREGDAEDPVLDEVLRDLRPWLIACKLRAYDVGGVFRVYVYRGEQARDNAEAVDVEWHSRLSKGLWDDAISML